MTYEALLAFFDLPFVSIFIVLSCEGKVLSRCRRERGFCLSLCGGVFRCVSIFFFLLVLEKAAQKDRRWRNDLLFLQAKQHIEEDYHYSALFLSTCGGKEKEREREDTRRDDERQQRARASRR